MSTITTSQIIGKCSVHTNIISDALFNPTDISQPFTHFEVEIAIMYGTTVVAFCPKRRLTVEQALMLVQEVAKCAGREEFQKLLDRPVELAKLLNAIQI